MRLHCLHIDGFGRFGTPSDFEFDHEGLTVVYGDNERGKTTIKDAICATIFGFQTTDEKNKYRPWNATSYAAQITFSAHNNVYCIERDFDTDEVTVWEVSKSKEKQTIFQGVANPRGWGADHEAYFDFIKEKIGFDSPDIFRLTTLVEQMQTKTKISDKIRQLISGSERADYTTVVKILEAELEKITRDIPGKNLRRKREIETIGERIAELSKAIADSQEDLVTACQVQAQIQTLEKEIGELKNESDAKKKSLEALGKYIQVEKGLSTTRRNLELLQEQSETLENIRKKVDSLGSGGSGIFTKVPVMIAVLTVIISVVLWWVFENLLLVVVTLVSGILISVVSYFLGLQTSALKDIHIDENRQEEILKEQISLQQQMFDLDSLRDGILAKYPAFAQADVSTLLTMQEDMNHSLKIFEEKIEQKKNELYNLNAKIGIIEQKATDFHFWEQEKKILEENLKYLERRKKALIKALSVLKECIREYQFRHIEELKSYITGAFKKITNGRYTSVTLEEDTLEPFVSTGSKSHIKKESLSVGALEQLYFAMRLSMSYLLSRNAALPFLLDDSFISYDDKRLENIKYILSRVKRTNQVILFVHDPFYKEWADTVIDLNRHYK